MPPFKGQLQGMTYEIGLNPKGLGAPEPPLRAAPPGAPPPPKPPHNLEQILWLLLRGVKYGVIAKTSLSRHDSLGKSELGKMLLMRIT